MTSISDQISSLVSAIGVGLLIGLEREHRKSLADGIGRTPGGLRTFVLAAVIGCVAILVGGAVALAAISVAIGLIICVAYHNRSTTDTDPGTTTEMALFLTLLLGGLAVRAPGFAIGIAVLATITLASRELIHKFVEESVNEFEIRDGLILATAALVIWPLLPDRTIDPLDAINPQNIWMMVVLVMLMGAVGHLGTRLPGPRLGLSFAGLTSGFVSSTATIASMGERASQHPALLKPAVAGATLSTIATFIQLAVLLGAISTSTLIEFLPELGTGVLISTALGLLFAVRRETAEIENIVQPSRMFSIQTALGFASLLVCVLLIAALLNRLIGSNGISVAAAIAGIADVHSSATTVASFVASSTISSESAQLPLLLAVTINTISKIAMAVVNGTPAFSVRVVPGLLLVLAGVWLVNLLT